MEFLKDREQVRELYASIEKEIENYFNSLQGLDNLARYKHGKLTVAALTFLGPTGATQLSKLGKLKEVLRILKNYTRSQMDEFLLKFRRFMDERLVQGAGSLLDDALIAELRAARVKFTEADLKWIFKNSEGKIIFLEKGNTTSGFEHILNHKQEFIDAGIGESNISDFIMQALKENKIVDYQGTGTGRPIYELIYNGAKKRVAITTGNNGYVVGANMKSAP